MTDLRKAAEMALDALEELRKDVTGRGATENWDAYYHKEGDALDALRQALAQPEQEKMCVSCGKPTMHMGDKCYGCCQIAQPKQEHKPWVSLTEEESSDIYNAHHNTYGECITSAYDLVLDVEAKLKEKNGG